MYTLRAYVNKAGTYNAFFNIFFQKVNENPAFELKSKPGRAQCVFIPFSSKARNMYTHKSTPSIHYYQFTLKRRHAFLFFRS